jgi:hypothetical protein
LPVQSMKPYFSPNSRNVRKPAFDAQQSEFRRPARINRNIGSEFPVPEERDGFAGLCLDRDPAVRALKANGCSRW